MDLKQINDCKQQKEMERLDEICNEAFADDVASYKNVRAKIKDVNEEKLLKESIDNLCGELGIKDQIEKETLQKMRVDLRFKVFQTRASIKIEKLKTDKIDWDQVCQLLEEHVKPSSRQQRLEWYKYIEDQEVNSSLLVKNSKNILKKKASSYIEASGQATIGLANVGGTANVRGDIHVASTTHCYGKKSKKANYQRDDQSDSDTSDSDESS